MASDNNHHDPGAAMGRVAERAETLLDLLTEDPAANMEAALAQEATLGQGAREAIAQGHWRDAHLILQTVYRLHQLQEREMDSADLRNSAMDALAVREPLGAEDGGAELFCYVMYTTAEASFMNGDMESASNVNGMLRSWLGERIAGEVDDSGFDALRLNSALHQAGVIATRAGRYEEAFAFFDSEEAQLEASGEDGDAVWGELHFGIGQVHHSQQDYENAKVKYTLSLSLYELTDDYRSQVKVLRALGLASNFQGQQDWAHYYYSRALRITEDQGDRLLSIPVMHSLGTVEHVRSNYDAARNWYNEALRRSDAAQQFDHMCVEFHHLGTLSQLEGNYDEAQSWLEVAHQYRTEMGDVHGAAEEARQLGLLFHEQQRWDDAQKWYRMAVEGYEEDGDPLGAARTYGQMALVEEERGNNQDAVRWALTTNRLSEDHGLEQMEALSREHLEKLQAAVGDELYQRWVEQFTDEEPGA